MLFRSITIDHEISWEDSAAVSADYEGTGPDMGAFEYSDTQTGMRNIDNIKIPGSMELFQNYPNPFNPQTTIKYVLHHTDHVRLSVYNLLGKKIKILTDEKKNPGIYTATWHGKDESGTGLASGIYLFELNNGREKIINKSILLR